MPTATSSTWPRARAASFLRRPRTPISSSGRSCSLSNAAAVCRTCSGDVAASIPAGRPVGASGVPPGPAVAGWAHGEVHAPPVDEDESTRLMYAPMTSAVSPERTSGHFFSWKSTSSVAAPLPEPAPGLGPDRGAALEPGAALGLGGGGGRFARNEADICKDRRG